MPVNLDDYTKIPLEEFTTPAEGDVVTLNRWWIVLDGCVLFTRHGSAQCNAKRDVAEAVRDKLYPGADVTFVEVGYIKRRTQPR